MKNKFEKIQIAEVLEELGLPANSEYLGYAIHRPDTDEYLAAFKDNNGAEFWGWAKTPQLAMKYEDYNKVLADAERYDKAPTMVGLVFDVGNQLIFVSQS